MLAVRCEPQGALALLARCVLLTIRMSSAGAPASGANLPGAVYFAGTEESQASGVDTEESQASGVGGTRTGPDSSVERFIPRRLPATLDPLPNASEQGKPTANIRERRCSVEGVVTAKQRAQNTSFRKARSAHPRISHELVAGSRGAQWLSGDYTEDEVITNATHGQLKFKHGRGVLNPAAGSLEEARQARFMRVKVDSKRFEDLSPSEQVDRVGLFKGLVDFMQHVWKMEMPSVIFSVTGSAKEFALRPKFRDTFMSSLLNATRSTNAWIVTGGSDSGIMKLVGDTLARDRQMQTALAIASWGAVHGRTELTPSKCKAQEELTRSMPACTVRIETDDSRVYTEEKLTELFSRYGPVIGVSLSKSSSSLKRLLKRAMTKQVSTASFGPDNQRVAQFAFVTFRDRASAENAAHNKVLQFRVSQNDPAPAVLHCRLLERDENRHVDERRVYTDHQLKILAQRGGAWLPFVYDGVRGGDEQEIGTRLNPNYSHYLLVDTGTQGFFQEIIFRSELLDFISFRHDAKKTNTKSEMKDLASLMRGRSKDDKRSVPVIALVYGGGPGTLTQILEHVRTCDPVIIVVGSGRAADLICEWKDFREDMEACTKRFGGDPNNLIVRLNDKKVSDRQTSRVRRWILSLPQAKMPTTPEQELELQDQVKSLRKQLDTICDFELIYFFDFQQKLDPTVKIIKDSLLARQGSNPHLLAIVLKAIFRSPNVRDSIKLPLAVRYGDRYQVKQLMKKQGIEQGRWGDELTSDARPMVYAAFHNDVHTVQELLRYGTHVRCIDHLILTEFCAMLSNRHILKSTHLDPPLPWMQGEVTRHMSLHRNEWMALSPEEQQQVCLSQWAALPLQEQQKICCDDVSAVRWKDLPYLGGYKYKVLCSKIKEDSGETGSSSAPTVGAPVGTPPATGALFRQLKVRHVSRQGDGAGIEIDLVISEQAPNNSSTDVSAQTLVGRVVSAAEAQRFAVDAVSSSEQNATETACTEEAALVADVRWEFGGVWVIATVVTSDQQFVRMLLQQQITDEITRCLILDSPGRWLLSKSTPGSIGRAVAAFRPWLPAEMIDGRVDKSWHSIHDSNCAHSCLSSELHPLHRLHWAIVTGREELAQLFWRQSENPIVFSILASYTYRHTEVYAKSHKKKRAMEYDTKAEALLEILNNVPELAGGQQMHVLMDEYVYFPEGEDIVQVVAGLEHGTMTQYGMLTHAEKKENAKTRSALALMGADSTVPLTLLDLAIRAENKLFMAHRATQEFLDSMWTISMGNGQWLDTFLNTTPKTKFYAKLLGYIAAILLLWVVFVQMPTANEMHQCVANQQQWCGAPQEWLLWLWWLGALVNEGFEYRESRSVQTYLVRSGNQLDCAVISCLFLALGCRVLVLILGTSSAAVWVYRSMMMLLTLCIFAMSFRLVHMFSFNRRLGIIKIVLVRIISMDVVPFLLYLCVTLLSFETANSVFGWLHDEQLADRGWGFSIYAFTESINDIRDAEVLEKVGRAISEHEVTVSVSVFREVFNMVFFVVTVVILMNVLSAPPLRMPASIRARQAASDYCSRFRTHSDRRGG